MSVVVMSLISIDLILIDLILIDLILIDLILIDLILIDLILMSQEVDELEVEWKNTFFWALRRKRNMMKILFSDLNTRAKIEKKTNSSKNEGYTWSSEHSSGRDVEGDPLFRPEHLGESWIRDGFSGIECYRW